MGSSSTPSHLYGNQDYLWPGGGVGGGVGSLGSSTGFAFHEFAGFWLPMKILEEEYKLKCGSIAVNILEYAQKNKEVKKSFSLFRLSCRL